MNEISKKQEPFYAMSPISSEKDDECIEVYTFGQLMIVEQDTAKQIFKELEEKMPKGLDGRCITNKDFQELKQRWLGD